MAFKKLSSMGSAGCQNGGDGVNFDSKSRMGYRVMCDILGISVPAYEITMGTGIREGLLISRLAREKYDEQLIIEGRNDDTAVPFTRVRDQDYT